MSQNNMITFITLTDLEAGKLELNPAFIMFMTRDTCSSNENIVSLNSHDTYHPQEIVSIPFTKVFLSSGDNLHVLETPEEINHLQMQTLAKTMNALMPIVQEVMEEFH
jgi:hypothetical protein